MSYVVPKFKENSFTCPHCGVLAQQLWSETRYTWNSNNSKYDFHSSSSIDEKSIAVSTCNSCRNEHLWYKNNMLIPKVANVPLPIDDMPEKVKDIYNEAREVYPVSAKASVALLRLAVQYLCVELGEKGKNINTDIGELVKKGLPIKIQRALDIVRVVGNNAVHPGVLNLEDNNVSAAYLFDIINIIVDNRIVQPRRIDEFYNSLPQTALDGIVSRDNQ